MSDAMLDMWMPSIDDEIPAAAPKLQQQIPIVPTPTVALKKKRRRHAEHDGNGQWTDVRRFDRMPITTNDAAELEEVSGVPAGAYFVSLARKRLQGIINLHDRWLKKIKNRGSTYALTQSNLREFYVDVLAQFDIRYESYITHPLFDQVGVTRSRQTKKTEQQ